MANNQKKRRIYIWEREVGETKKKKSQLIWNTNFDFHTVGKVPITGQPAKRPVSGFCPWAAKWLTKEAISVVCLFSRRPQRSNLDTYRKGGVCITSFSVYFVNTSHSTPRPGLHHFLIQIVHWSSKGKLKEAKAIQMSNAIGKKKKKRCASPPAGAGSPDRACSPTSRLLAPHDLALLSTVSNLATPLFFFRCTFAGY